jgi:hypothetical protein
MHSTQAQNAQRTKDHVIRQNARAPRRHLVSPSQEMTDASFDMVIHRPIRQQSGPVAEVTRPAAQKAVQLAGHFRPTSLIAGLE